MADLSHKHAAPRRRQSRASRLLLPTIGLMAVVGAGSAAVMHDSSPVKAGASLSAAAPKAASEPEPQAKAKRDVLASSAGRGAIPTTVSRSAERPPMPNASEVAKQIEGLRYVTTPLQIHADAKSSSPVLAAAAEGGEVDITGETKGKWAEIIHNGVPRWVEAKGLAKEMPLGTEPCATGSAVESGLQPDTIKVYRAVCDRFPDISSYGGMAGRGEHGTGQALDIMVRGARGDEIAAFLMENRAKLGIDYLIWKQRIWRPATSASWRGMSNRGGDTANHFDHVHVTTYGNSAQ